MDEFDVADLAFVRDQEAVHDLDATRNLRLDPIGADAGLYGSRVPGISQPAGTGSDLYPSAAAPAASGATGRSAGPSGAKFWSRGNDIRGLLGILFRCRFRGLLFGLMSRFLRLYSLRQRHRFLFDLFLDGLLLGERRRLRYQGRLDHALTAAELICNTDGVLLASASASRAGSKEYGLRFWEQ